MKKGFILLLLIASAWTVQAQVSISEDYTIERMMARYKIINQSKKTTAGWRIQVLAATDRRKVEAAYHKFQEQYPSIPCNWKHVSPYYKLQAGAYLTRLEAIAALESIKRNYRTAFPTADKYIRISELNK